MNGPAIFIRFDDNVRTYGPGDRLSGEYWLEAIEPGDIRSIEVSVLWHTEGKGNEDLAVHDFRRLSAEGGDVVADLTPESKRAVNDRSDLPENGPGKLARNRCVNRFAATLPNSPLSYDGAIVKLRWCVRVRVFLTRGREVVAQRRFRLGRVPPAKAIKSPTAVPSATVVDETPGSLL